jgi:hypothetical protein
MAYTCILIFFHSQREVAMNVRARHLALVSIVWVASIAVAGPVFAAQKGAGGVSDGPSCYNKVTENCNAKYPGKDMGNADYKACIESGLDICDITYPLKGAAVPGKPPVVRAPVVRAPTEKAPKAPISKAPISKVPVSGGIKTN